MMGEGADLSALVRFISEFYAEYHLQFWTMSPMGKAAEALSRPAGTENTAGMK